MIKLNYWLAEWEEPLQSYQADITEIHKKLTNKEDAYTGWVDWPLRVEASLVEDILTTAKEIRKQCTAFVVIGIGGSYLGSKACIELLQPPFFNEYYAQKHGSPRIYFAGHPAETVPSNVNP